MSRSKIGEPASASAPAGRAATAQQALETVKADLKALNASVEVSQKGHNEAAAIKAMFLNEDYRQ